MKRKDRNTTLIPPVAGEESSKWKGTYTWSVENFSKLNQRRIYSPEFEVGGYYWRLRLFPKRNGSRRTTAYIAVYLNFEEVAYMPQQMCPTARFKIRAVKRKDCTDSQRRSMMTHNFTSSAPGQGYSSFLSLRELMNRQNGYLVNDTLTLRVSIYIQKDKAGVTPELNAGFLGIKSSEETSSLNSFLQCLFHIKLFRKAIFQMPTEESNDPQSSFALSLQHLFYKLQYHQTSPETVDQMSVLDRILGNAPLGHDVLEIKSLLFKGLTPEGKTGSMQDYISRLFTGVWLNYNKSSTFQETRTLEESYKKISFDVLEGSDIYGSLEKFCQTDISKEDIHRRKMSQGLVQSRRYVLFNSFPTVLQINLKRCYYSSNRDTIIKINSHYEFYDELDLDYNDGILLSENADRTVENKYRLHSVVAYQNDNGKGHYCVYIRPHEKWHKFDGEVVKEVCAKEAIDEQFGDQNSTVSANFSKGFKSINKSVAVMLIYIRKSEWNMVMCDATKECLPKHIRVSFEKERMAREEQEKEKNEAHLYVNIKLATEFHFASQIGERHYFDLVDFNNVKKYRIHKKTSFEDFKETVSKGFGIPKHLQRFWLWTQQTNDTIRVCKPLIKGGIDWKTVLDLKRFKEMKPPLGEEKTALMTINLFLETPEGYSPRTDGFLQTIQQDDLLIFIKYYDPALKDLSYLGHMFVKKNCRFCMVLKRAKKMAGLGLKDEIIGVKEVTHLPEVICADLSPEKRVSSLQIVQGDIVIIQKIDASTQCEYPTVNSFLEFIQNTKTVTFIPLKSPKDGGFRLDLLKTMDYEQVTNELAKHLQIEDPRKLRLTQYNIYAHEPCWSHIKYNGMESLEEMILHTGQSTRILYYEVLDVQLPYLETLKCLNIQFHNTKGALQSRHQLRLSKRNRVLDLIQALKLELGEEYNNLDLRIMLAHGSIILKILDPECALEHLYESYWNYRAEVIPEDHKNLKSDEDLVLFCPCKQGHSSWTILDDSFWVKVKTREPIEKVKARVQKTLELSDEEFSNLSFKYYDRAMHPVRYLENENELSAKLPSVAVEWRNSWKVCW